MILYRIIWDIMALVKTGFVYKLVSKDINVKECYVGSTGNITKRKNCHKSACNNVKKRSYNYRVYQYIRANSGFENWDIIVLETVQYNEKYELKAHERRHMETIGATLNSATPNRTQAEWCEDNAEYVQQQHKQYYQDNAKKLKQKANQKHECECGGKYTHQNKERHAKTKKHMAYIENN